jgi:hypothetical protein
LPVVARILLVLTAVHAGIVGNDYDKTRVNACIRRAENRVRGYVQSDVFHYGHRPRTRNRRAVSDFRRNFFVGRPLDRNFGILRKKFGSFR